jgi:hypothetical protein
MQYGLDLTHALIERIQALVSDHHGQLVVFYTDTHDFDSESDQVYGLNGKFYRVSKRQFQTNWRDVNSGFATEAIPVTLQDWRVSPEDGHLNTHATDVVMSELAERLRPRIGGRAYADTNAR